MVDTPPPPCPTQERSVPLENVRLVPMGAERPRQSDYRHRLRATSEGLPVLPLWCVWVEPLPENASRWDRRWWNAVGAALDTWSEHLPLVPVTSRQQAHVWVLRQRPARRRIAGRMRASHGRSSLQVRRVRRRGIWRLEPKVRVLVSPDQRREALQATALHELGHAFGLWGHSDDAMDVMAVSPGRDPLLQLSPRDRATLRWVLRQPTPFGQPLSDPGR
jgi:predicted Zn-dependent protease